MKFPLFPLVLFLERYHFHWYLHLLSLLPNDEWKHFIISSVCKSLLFICFPPQCVVLVFIPLLYSIMPLFSRGNIFAKSMFSDLLYCADCGKKLWFHVNSINKIRFFSCSNYAKDYRGTCPTRHYIRADSIEQVVKLELRRMAQLLQRDEEAFAAILEKKANADILAEQRHLETELTKAIARSETVAQLYERLYEDNVSGKVTDEWFMQLSHKYEVERMELKEKIAETRQRIASLNTMQQNKDHFLAAVRKFMEMETLTPPLLRELIDHIDVYETQGTGKHRTQRVTIFYRFVGYIDIPESPEDEPYTADTRQGVAVKYIPKLA